MRRQISGCGTICVSPTIVDLRAGKYVPVGFTLTWGINAPVDFKPIDVRPNSRLIVFAGARNEKPPYGYHYYVLENGQLRFLRTVATDEDFSTLLPN
jgi:hypothetical protein